jgi:hypothetical protein
MEKQHSLTNEKLSHKFKSQFEMVNYSISLVKNMVNSGRPPRIRMETQNPAIICVEEISQGKDRFEEIILVKPPEPAIPAVNIPLENESAKAPEKKKPRRIL